MNSSKRCHAEKVKRAISLFLRVKRITAHGGDFAKNRVLAIAQRMNSMLSGSSKAARRNNKNKTEGLGENHKTKTEGILGRRLRRAQYIVPPLTSTRTAGFLPFSGQKRGHKVSKPFSASSASFFFLLLSISEDPRPRSRILVAQKSELSFIDRGKGICSTIVEADAAVVEVRIGFADSIPVSGLVAFLLAGRELAGVRVQHLGAPLLCLHCKTQQSRCITMYKQKKRLGTLMVDFWNGRKESEGTTNLSRGRAGGKRKKQAWPFLVS
ncbi:hypothetical protein H6P81_004761 [Aristolochia fimbriata]|uniref:Ribosomal protein S11 n=1 Tax=Aristolochia fimbriata TaxID=158543 RepID=A0AAV7EW61_ARIFI|nr:hypothetical protein H6P81_004761 [Aristolochia fimbriata]